MTFINNYIVSYTRGSQECKRTKRKLHKKKMTKFCKFIDGSDNSFLQNLRQHLAEASKGHVGYIDGSNILVRGNIMDLPPTPMDWDILHVAGDIGSYDFSNKQNCAHWCAVTLTDTSHFVIHKDAIPTVRKALEPSKCKTWESFIAFVNTLRVFAIKNADKPSVSRYTAHRGQDVNTPRKTHLDVKQQYLPKVSLVCVVTDLDKTFHTILTFLRLAYPADKLELVLVDDTGSSKHIEKVLPVNDPVVRERIKLVSLSQELPFVYKLNMAVKYAKHNIVCHMFDTMCYLPSTFSQNIWNFMLSNKEAMVSNDTTHHTSKGLTSMSSVPDLGCMVYTKDLWDVQPFTSENARDFLQERSGCFAYQPSAMWGFQGGTEVDLTELLCSQLKESYHIAFEKMNI